MTDTNTLLGWLNQFVTHRRIDEVMDGADYEAVQDMNTHLRAQEARIAALTKDAEPATTCPRIELVVAIHSLASDFENMSYSFGADTEDRKRAQGSIKHAMAVANKHNQNGAGCITHPPAPELKPLSLDEIHQRYKNLRVNEPPHYIDIYRDAEAALGILRGGL